MRKANFTSFSNKSPVKAATVFELNLGVRSKLKKNGLCVLPTSAISDIYRNKSFCFRAMLLNKRWSTQGELSNEPCMDISKANVMS